MHTSRDREIVDWIGRLGAAGPEHVMERFGMGRSSAYSRLRSLAVGGLLEQRGLLHRQPALYVATKEGLRWCGLQRLGLASVGPGIFRHASETARVAAELANLPGSGRVLSERVLRVEEADAGRLIASAKIGELPGGAPAVHRPDLAVLTVDGAVFAIEVELSPKAPRRLQAICTAWARARHVDVVYYLAGPEAAAGLARAVRVARAGEKIVVFELDQAARVGEVSNARS